RTTFSDPDGEVVLTDALATGPNEEGHDLGTHAPGALIRRVECTRGRMRIAVELAPRPEY
ncbi:MAG: hypothetical protein GWN07_26540, partial [Actinobacteria bacterium]|nr:hypothetical protein [Actinomycetota bacterium]NIX23195.1 hypothetical protein [Actinomycetota bacterium]